MKPTKYTVDVRLSRESIRKVEEDLKAKKARRKHIVNKFLTIYGKRSAAVVRKCIAEQHPQYNSQLTASVSWRVSGNRVKVWMDDPYATGAIYFEYGTGPQGAAHPHPDADGWSYGPAWYTRAGGKDMENMYDWKKYGDGVYYTSGQPAHPFWYNAMEKITEEDFIDDCWMEAKKRA